MIRVFSSRSGDETATCDGVLLHSSYDPGKEAERYLERIGTDGKSVFLVLGPGLGYLIEALRRRLPSAKILAFQYLPELVGRRTENLPCWSPGCGMSVGGFLERYVSDYELEEIQVIEWEPSARASPAVAREVSEKIVQTIRERQGSLLTTEYFGRRWVKNAFINFLTADRCTGLSVHTPVLLIAASGASLEASIPLIREARDRLTLWALPSSLDALLQADVWPDLVVLSDPGHYSSRHLHILSRRLDSAASGTAIAMPLTAVAGAGRAGLPLVLLSQGTAVETAIARGAALAPTYIPANGTVSGTALLLAGRLSVKHIVCAGLDFCTDDVRAHVHPHAFDHIVSGGENRFRPVHSLMYGEAVERYPERIPGSSARTCASLKTYAGWFSESAGRYAHLYRLLPSAVEIPGMTPLDRSSFLSLTGSRTPSPGSLAAIPLPGARERRKIVAEILSRWSEEILCFDRGISERNHRDLFPIAGAGTEILALLCGRDLRVAAGEFRRGGIRGARDRLHHAAHEAGRFVSALLASTTGEGAGEK